MDEAAAKQVAVKTTNRKMSPAEPALSLSNGEGENCLPGYTLATL